jgi:hypothetical protein
VCHADGKSLIECNRLLLSMCSELFRECLYEPEPKPRKIISQITHDKVCVYV